MHHASIALAAPASVQAWVSRLWVSTTSCGSEPVREHVLPSGQMHLVVRLSGPPLRLFAQPGDQHPTTIDGPVVGGARSSFYAKELAGTVVSVGAVLRPGASLALFGVGADELAEHHTALSDLWGAAANTLHERLAETSDPLARIHLLTACLLQRSGGARPLPHPVQHTMAALSAQPARIAALVRAGVFSHRSFINQFRHATGLAPKQFARLMRFRRVLDTLASNPASALADVALDCGFSDQAHMAREFRAMAGVTASQYRALAPANASHVPVATAR